MNVCPKCGRELAEGERFCTVCGEEIPASAEPSLSAGEAPRPVPSEAVNAARPAPVPYRARRAAWNVYCVFGFALAFGNPVAGLILSVFGLVSTEKTGERGRGLAIAGLIVSAAVLLLAVLLAVLFTLRAGEMYGSWYYGYYDPYSYS